MGKASKALPRFRRIRVRDMNYGFHNFPFFSCPSLHFDFFSDLLFFFWSKARKPLSPPYPVLPFNRGCSPIFIQREFYRYSYLLTRYSVCIPLSAYDLSVLTVLSIHTSEHWTSYTTSNSFARHIPSHHNERKNSTTKGCSRRRERRFT